MADRLPIDPVLPEIVAALHDPGACVLQAPPGAGKTTRVPLAVREAGISPGRILMLEPRRVAARAAAERLAEGLGETPGGRVGYRMRGDSRPGREIEVVTDGILTRMLQSDPELKGIGCVIFDEFHERALQADLGLALLLEAREALRPDLRLIVMSATLDAAPVAELIGDAPVVTAEGRSYPVETRYMDRPQGPGVGTGRDFIAGMADLTLAALSETRGGALVFLPGRGEIERLLAALRNRVPGDVDLRPLHGGLPFKAQRAALTPAAPGRRACVLATAIAETSLTIPDVRVVIDGGRARRARLDPGTGMSRLVTERVTRAEAEQRRGRAGRVAPGTCYRFWSAGEEGALGAFPPAEIEAGDLAGMALELALWGAGSPDDLPFLTRPGAGQWAAAVDLLTALGLRDAAGGLTAAGRAAAALPVHPRLAAMLLAAGGGGRVAGLAALLDNRDLLIPGPAAPGSDLTLRLAALDDPRREEAARPWRVDRGRRAEVAETAKRLARLVPPTDRAALSPGAALSLAYPDRIALRRPGDQPRYLLSGGSGASLDAADPLAGQRCLVAADLDGDRREARIRLALPVTEAEIRALHGDRIEERRVARWSRRHRQVEARIEERLGAIVLSDRPWTDAGDADLCPAFLAGIRDLGLGCLNWTAGAQALRDRVDWLNARGAGLPPLDDRALLDALETWLGPWLAGMRRFDEVRALDPAAPLDARLGPEARALADRLAPARFVAPTGTRVRIDYSGDSPVAAIRLQEVFGLDTHPVLGPDRVPLTLSLLSPAGRPVQTTADLPGFWRTSYADVRKDMRGRYPKHAWPEDPLDAAPTRRTRAADGRRKP